MMTPLIVFHGGEVIQVRMTYGRRTVRRSCQSRVVATVRVANRKVVVPKYYDS